MLGATASTGVVRKGVLDTALPKDRVIRCTYYSFTSTDHNRDMGDLSDNTW